MPRQRNNRLVWDESVRIMLELVRGPRRTRTRADLTPPSQFDDVWQDQEAIAVDHAPELTLPVRPSPLALSLPHYL
jgi:hypothetical protein